MPLKLILIGVAGVILVLLVASKVLKTAAQIIGGALALLVIAFILLRVMG